MSLEVPTSPGLAVSHFAAGLETANLHHETISPDLSFCGITKLEDLQSADFLHKIGLSPQTVPAYLGEVRQVLELLQAAGIDPRQTRRALRERIGDGGYPRSEREPISRSDAVRAAFNRASGIAADQDAPIIMVQHLLAALLEITDTHTRVLLTDMGVDVDKLRDDAAALPVPKPVVPNGGGILDQLGTDLTEKARASELAPVIGRKDEMMQVIKTLGRSKKNCPVLVGAAGVGKSAIVEGLAQRIADRRLNPRILDDFQAKRIVQISASSLVAGTQYRGQFEERMERLIAEVRADPNLILFVDEIHLLVGAGAGGSGGMDAANILKPALASGEIKLIGATTDAEYRQYIEKDAALERRFQRVNVMEPSPQETVEMLAGVRGRLQDKHQVTITNEAILAAVELAVRYITDQQLPDKAYTLLDDACAWVRYGSVLSASPLADSGDIILNEVTPETVREVIADRLGIPVEQFDEDEKQRIQQMPEILKARVIGQDAAIETVTRVVQRHYIGINDHSRPVGVFLFTGPTGVGKTELAKALADFLFQDEKRLIRLDMSEYMEKHNVSRLIGAPPGYVGHEQGGELTNALRKTPAAIVLIDEIEKAHPDVVNIFLQVFDDGRLTDGQGRTVNAKNALFIMTSNLGYDQAGVMPAPEDVQQAVYGHFRPEFMGRVDEIAYFQPLGMHMAQLVAMQVERLNQRLERNLITVECDQEAVRWLAEHGYDPRSGARGLIRLFTQKVTDPVGGLFISGALSPGEMAHVVVRNEDIHIETEVLDTGFPPGE